jgi:transposase InsO family protein
MALANPLWGAPRIHGELLKLGLDVSQRTVARLMPRRPKPPSQTWRTFLQNHLADLVSVDFFVVPTATFRVLYVFVVLLPHRRQVVHFNVTDSPTAAWTAQQIVETFPDESAPRYLLRDRDSIYGGEFQRRVKGMRIAEVLTAPRSPWQNPFAERVIGTIRRELLDHVIVLNEGHLRRRLRSYLRYYHCSRTHLALDKDAPEPRAVEPPQHGRVVALPQVGGLHHRYVRRAQHSSNRRLSRFVEEIGAQSALAPTVLPPAAPSTRAHAQLRGTRHMTVIGVLDHSHDRRCRSGISWGSTAAIEFWPTTPCSEALRSLTVAIRAEAAFAA